MFKLRWYSGLSRFSISLENGFLFSINKMFKLNNAEERRLLVKQKLESLNVTRVADLGCGAGPFIRYLVNGKNFDFIVSDW